MKLPHRAVAVVILIIVLILLSILLVLLYRHQKLATLSKQKSEYVSQIEPINTYSTDPAKMLIAADQSTVEWEIHGRLIAPLEIRGDFLVGKFVLEGDNANFPLTLWFGPKGTYQILGRLKIDNNAEGSSTTQVWTKTPLDEMSDQIPINQPISVHVINHKIKDSLSEINAYRNFWQDINAQINNQGKVTTLTIEEPELWIYSNKVGIDL